MNTALALPAAPESSVDVVARGAVRGVDRVARAHTRISTATYRVLNLNAQQLRGAFDPFLGVDHFHMRVPMFPPHPHAGFCSLTYLFEDSEGALVCRDSLGHSAVLHGGDLCWTTAGRGIVHEEVPQRPGHTVHGLQIFVNLPAPKKRIAPSVQHVDAPYMPVVHADGGTRVRVVVGRYGDAEAPIAPAVPVTLLDVTIPAGGAFVHDAPEENVIAYVLAGNGTFGEKERFVRRADAASFARNGERIAVRAGKSGMRLVMFAGKPLREKVYARGPFIMSSHAELDAAFEDYRLGRMGSLDASF